MRPVSPHRGGWILPGSELCFGQDHGWKSFGHEISAVACVVGVVPTDSHRVSPGSGPSASQLCSVSPALGSQLCPLLITSALEIDQKAVNWQKNKA